MCHYWRNWLAAHIGATGNSANGLYSVNVKRGLLLEERFLRLKCPSLCIFDALVVVGSDGSYSG